MVAVHILIKLGSPTKPTWMACLLSCPLYFAMLNVFAYKQSIQAQLENLSYIAFIKMNKYFKVSTVGSGSGSWRKKDGEQSIPRHKYKGRMYHGRSTARARPGPRPVARRNISKIRNTVKSADRIAGVNNFI